jgi:hypothetical protein
MLEHTVTTDRTEQMVELTVTNERTNQKTEQKSHKTHETMEPKKIGKNQTMKKT